MEKHVSQCFCKHSPYSSRYTLPVRLPGSIRHPNFLSLPKSRIYPASIPVVVRQLLTEQNVLPKILEAAFNPTITLFSTAISATKFPISSCSLYITRPSDIALQRAVLFSGSHIQKHVHITQTVKNQYHEKSIHTHSITPLKFNSSQCEDISIMRSTFSIFSHR